MSGDGGDLWQGHEPGDAVGSVTPGRADPLQPVVPPCCKDRVVRTAVPVPNDGLGRFQLGVVDAVAAAEPPVGTERARISGTGVRSICGPSSQMSCRGQIRFGGESRWLSTGALIPRRRMQAAHALVWWNRIRQRTAGRSVCNANRGSWEKVRSDSARCSSRRGDQRSRRDALRRPGSGGRWSPAHADRPARRKYPRRGTGTTSRVRCGSRRRGGRRRTPLFLRRPAAPCGAVDGQGSAVGVQVVGSAAGPADTAAYRRHLVKEGYELG
jgi:hypothetical protein